MRRWAALAGSSGRGSLSFRPAGVALMATSGSSTPRAGAARTPCPRAQSANARARAASRESTCRSAFAAAAATATARAAPPVPVRSQVPPPSAPSWRSAAWMPATSVLSPTSAPCSVQNVLQAPTRAHTSVFRATHRSAASLCGTVTFPAPPTAARAASMVVSSGADVRSATYTASRPRTRIAAFCIEGESEWATGSPITASRRVLALTSTRELFGDALHGRLEERLELDARVAVHVEIAAKRIAHFGLVPLAAGVLAQYGDVTLAAQLVHARPVVPRHGEDQVRAVDQLARQEPRPMAREIEPALEPHEIGSLGHRGAVPGPGAGRGDRDPLDATLHERALEQGRRERAAADVASAHQQDAFRVRFLVHGASRPAARRSSPSVTAPWRISRGVGCVQSTTVDGGEFPRTPPSSTSSVPASTAGAKSRTIASAPGAGGLPGKLADVDVTGSPSARTNLAIPRWDVQRTAIPPSGPRSGSGSRPLPPGSTRVSGPGQKARASALADSLNARPCASAMSRSATSSRNGLSGRRPLRRATACTSGPLAREPRPYTVSVG